MSDRKSLPPDADDAIQQLRRTLDRRVAMRKARPIDPSVLDNAWAAAKAHQRLAGSGDVQPAANDETIDCPVFRFAADTASTPDSPTRRVPAPESPERFTLTQSRLIGGGAVSLMFKAEQESIGRYVGAHITLSIGPRTFDLGSVNAAGVARQRVDGDIADSAHCVVHIRKSRGVPT